MYQLYTNIPESYNGFCKVLILEYTEYLISIGEYRKKDDNAIENSVKCFLYNVSLSGRKIVVSLDKKYYHTPVIYNGQKYRSDVSYVYSKKFFTFLQSESYGVLEIGGYDGDVWVYVKEAKRFEKHKHFVSSYFTLFDKWFKIKNCMVDDDEVSILMNVIHMKDADKNYITYKMTPYLRAKRDYLQNWNEFAAENTLTVEDIRYPLQSYKIYNDSSQKVGGRTFTTCGYQNLSKEKRAMSIINGKPTICLDYSAFEASVMYTMVDEVMPMVDPYYCGMGGFDPQTERSIMKKVFMVMMNSSSRLSAIKATKYWVENSLDTDKLYEQGKIPCQTLSSKKLIDTMEKKHESVKDYFYSGKNENFNIQNIVSEINDFVVQNLFEDKKIMVGQVHDAFIVQSEYKDVLMEVMFTAYERVLGDNRNCRIKQEF